MNFQFNLGEKMVCYKLKLGIKALLACILVIALNASGATNEVKITSIQVQHNRTWINVSPDLGSTTTCSEKNAVEVSNDAENRDLIMSLAMSAMIANKNVVFINSGICGNVGKEAIIGVRVIN